MKLNLKENWAIHSSHTDYSLGKYIQVKGKQAYVPKGFYLTIDQALKGYADRRLLHSKAESWEEVLVILNEIKDEISDIKNVLIPV